MRQRSVAPGDLVAGLLATGLGLAVVLYVRRFPELPGGQPGPALFPGIVGGLLIVFGVVLAVRAIAARPRPVEPAADSDESSTHPDLAGEGPIHRPPRRRRRYVPVAKAAAVLAAVGVYLLAAGVLGFIPTMAALLWLLMLALGARPLPALGAAVLATLLIYYLFGMVLLVPLPLGPLG
ncbi:MAG: hypothetical protein GEV03_10680 [Streptosporangiales bacterium]|nr:hypothetical protein [Streptosporangiales bacterium]